jgi:hypothetical protein
MRTPTIPWKRGSITLAAAAAISAAAFGFASPAADGRTVLSLPLGTWEMNANGRQRTLTITSVGRNGELVASTQNTAEAQGRWIEGARKIVFTRMIDPKDKSTHHYLISDGELHLQGSRIDAGAPALRLVRADAPLATSADAAARQRSNARSEEAMRPFHPKLPAGTRALTVGPIALVLLAVSSAPAGAQQTPVDPDAYAVFELAKQKFWDRLNGVENYTLYQEQNGLVTTLYYEREMMDGVPVYVLVPPHEWEPELQQAPGAAPAPPGAAGSVPPGAPDLPEGMPGGLPDGPGDLPDPKQALMQKGMKALTGGIGSGDGDRSMGIDPRMMDRMGERARLAGTGPCYEAEDLEALRDPQSGATPSNPDCHLLEITDLSGLDFGEDGELEGFEFTSFEIRLDTRELVPRHTTVRGDVEMEGYAGEIVISAGYADYRQVDQMYEPFRRVIRMSGVADAVVEMMDEKDRKEMEKALEQLDEMEEQLAQMPPAQRKMVEQQMGKMVKQRDMMRKMRDGGGMQALGDYEVVIEVSELLVNAGPPDVTGEWTATVAGLGLALEIKGEAAGVGGTDEAWQVTMAVPVSGGLGRSSVIQLAWKRIGRGDLAVGETQGFGGVTLVLEDGREGTFQTDEEGAEIRIELVSRSRITGRFSFIGRGRISDGRTEEEVSLTVEGTFEAPAPPPLPAGMMP